MSSLSKLEYLKREALSQVILDYLKNKSESEGEKLLKSFFEEFKMKKEILEENIKNFLHLYELPNDLLLQWRKRVRLLIDPLVKEYLKWLPVEQKANFAEKILDVNYPLDDFLKDYPEFKEYINLEINTLTSPK